MNLVPATPSFGQPRSRPSAPVAKAPRPAPPRTARARAQGGGEGAAEGRPARAAAPPGAGPGAGRRAAAAARARGRRRRARRRSSPRSSRCPERAEKENPALPSPAPKAIERSLPPPPPVTPPARRPRPRRAAAATRAARESPRRRRPRPPRPRRRRRQRVPRSAGLLRSRVRPGRPTASTVVRQQPIGRRQRLPVHLLPPPAARQGHRALAAPSGAAATGGERVVVYFEIDRDGQVREPKVEQSSGNALYDQSALRAVIEASPFPPLPPEFKASSLNVHFGFDSEPGQGLTMRRRSARAARARAPGGRRARRARDRPAPSHSQGVEVFLNVTQGGSKKLGIAIPEFTRLTPAPDEGNFARGVPEIIGNDLRFSALFAVANTPALPAAQDGDQAGVRAPPAGRGSRRDARAHADRRPAPHDRVPPLRPHEPGVPTDRLEDVLGGAPAPITGGSRTGSPTRSSTSSPASGASPRRRSRTSRSSARTKSS